MLPALVQVTVWFGMVLLGSAVTVASLELAGIELPWLSLSLCVPFFGAGYLFLGSLMLGTGALGSNLKESQQFSLIWTFVTMVPLVFLQILLAEPHGTLGRVLTWIPFTTPLTVIFRTAIDAPGVAWWEIAGAFAVMLVSTWLAIRMGARLFRVGLLFTGARPKLREIIRQAPPVLNRGRTQKRSIRNSDTSTGGSSPSTIAAAASPRTGANLNPWPEHGLPTSTRRCPGRTSRTKCESGALV